MTYKTRIIQVTGNKASVGEVFEFDLSSIPEGMSFHEYIESPQYKEDREKLYNSLTGKKVKTRILPENTDTSESDIKEKEAE